MNFLFVVGGYYPNFSATGNCIRMIANELEKNGNNIFVVAEKKTINDEDFQIWNNQKIYRVATKQSLSRIKAINDNKRLPLFILKLVHFLEFLMNKGGLDKKMVKAYKEKMEKIVNENNFDAIIPCCMPIEGTYASFLISKMHLNIHLYPILFDLYSKSDIFFRNKFIKRLKEKSSFFIETNILKNSKFIFYVDNWEKYFKNNEYKNSLMISHPLISKKNIIPICLHNKKKINVIYQGEVSYEIRNPSSCLRILANLYEQYPKCDIKFHFFSFGNANFEVEKSKFIQLYPKVDKETADGYAADADVTLIIGNKNPTIVPSKVFECISIGKPILYFTANNGDSVSQLLKHYFSFFIVDVNEFSEKNIRDLYLWILNNYQKHVSFDDLSPFYLKSSPKYIVSQIINSMKVSENDCK